MESKFGYRFTRKAEADLDAISAYMAVELANPRAASDFIGKLQEVIEEARLFPESGAPVVNEFLTDNDVRQMIIDNYVMYYLPDGAEKMIYILRIVYGKRNMDEIMRNLHADD